LTISSDPREPKTMKEALLIPEKELWKEATEKEKTNFYVQRSVETSAKENGNRAN
jgi:hypothetical protein